MEILGTLTAIFVTVSIILYFFDWVGYPAIPAYIVGGLLISPLLELEELLVLGQVGILFLLYVAGLKFSFTDLKRSKGVISVSLLQIILVGSTGFVIGYTAGFELLDSLLFGFVAAFGSTLIGLELAETERHNKLLHGRLSESIHLIQDCVGLLLLTIILSYAAVDITTALTYIVLLSALTYLLRNGVFPFVANSIKHNQEIVMLLGVSTLLGFVYLCSVLGLPSFVGAFLAGISSAKFPYNLELLDTFGPIKDFFVALFFVVLGALVTIPTTEVLIIVFALLFLVVVLNPVITTFLLRLRGYSDRVSILTSLSLNHVSELSFVLAITGLLGGVISVDVFTIIVLTGAVSIVIATLMKKQQEYIYEFSKDSFDTETLNKEGHVLVVGAIPPGLDASKYLSSRGEDVVLVDTDSERLIEAGEGVEVYHGDVMNDDVLEHLCAKDAKMIISCAKSHQVSKKLLRFKDSEVFVYAEDMKKGKEYYEDGASYVLLKDMAIIDLLEEYVVGNKKDTGSRHALKEKGLAQLRKYEYR